MLAHIKNVELDTRKIVRAITKAVSEDVPDFMREHPMEFRNYIPMYRGDCISENVKQMVCREGMEVLKFKRNSWTGCLLIDRTNKITYSITTHRNLKTIPRKHRTRPHFVQSLLGVLNAGLQGQYVQMTLFPMDEFEQDELEDDYNKIVDGLVDPDAGFNHYVIAYTYDKNDVIKVDIEFLDGKFNIIEEKSLDEFIKPDYAKLTETVVSDNPAAEPVATETKKSLVAFKGDGLVRFKTDLQDKEA